MDEETKHADWNEMYAQLFNVDKEIPSFFIDPVYDEDACEAVETDKYQQYTKLLWDFMNNSSAYECNMRCKLEEGFCKRDPWILNETVNDAKRTGSYVIQPTFLFLILVIVQVFTIQ